MAKVSVELPEACYKCAAELAKQKGLPLDEFIARTLAEVLSADEYISARAARASRAKYDAVLRNVESRPPIPGDEIA